MSFQLHEKIIVKHMH